MSSTTNKRAVLFCGSALCILYICLAIAVNARLLQETDLRITLSLQSVVPYWLDLPASILSLAGSVEASVVLFAVLLLLSRPRARKILIVLFVLLGFIEIAGKTQISQPGPPYSLSRYVFHFGTPTGDLETPYSYPSGHSARTAFLVVVAASVIGRAGLTPRSLLLIGLVTLFGAAMLVSRVYIGDHWASDVIGGVALGTGLSLFVFLTD
jgi:undecaprenyl-diphosphatase